MAYLDLYQGIIYISPFNKTTAGFWYAESVSAAIDVDDVLSLHSGIRDALALSTSDFPTPTYDDKKYVAALKTAGIKSIRAFEKQGKAVEIILKEGEYHVTPCRKFEKMAGSEQMIEYTVKLPEGSTELASTALTLFELAT